MKQGQLFEAPLEAPLTHTGLTCAFGEPWEGPHPLCEAEADRACERFEAGVKAGKWDEAGYLPKERKAPERRKAHV